jgi:hypothetical protein
MDRLLYLLPVLACPLGMGLMMWLMMRRGHHDGTKPAGRGTPQDEWHTVGPLDAAERAELERLRAAAEVMVEIPDRQHPGHQSGP